MKTQVKPAQLLLIVLVASAAFCGFRAAGAQAPGDTSPASQAPGVVATGKPKGLFINIIEVASENWSPGKGLAGRNSVIPATGAPATTAAS